jgi:hypothetical protein
VSAEAASTPPPGHCAASLPPPECTRGPRQEPASAAGAAAAYPPTALGVHVGSLLDAGYNHQPAKTLAPAVAASGALEHLQQLQLHGCAWNARTCSKAAFRGNLEVLQWARAKRLRLGRSHVRILSIRWPPRGAAVGTGHWVLLGY